MTKIDWLFFGGIFALILKSMGAYFFWNVSIGYMSLFVSCLGYMYIKNDPNSHIPHNVYKAFVCLVLYSIWDRDIFSQLNMGNIIYCFPILFVLMIPSMKKQRLLVFCSKGLAIISGISLIAFIALFFTELPNIGEIVDETTEDVNSYYNYTNYVVLLKGAFYDIRFNAIFREPGHLAMISSYFLFANRFDLRKWYNITLLIVIFFTLSLAGYILLLIGYSFNLLLTDGFKRFCKRIFIFIAFLFIAVMWIVNYDDGDNIVNDLIVARLEYDEEKGIEGNNRVGGRTDQVFSEAIQNGSAIIGVGRDEQAHLASIGKVTGAGYKIHILSKGFIGTFLIFSFYYILARGASYRKFAFYMLLLYCISFWQRAYPIWSAWIIPFITSIYIYKPQNKNYSCASTLAKGKDV